MSVDNAQITEAFETLEIGKVLNTKFIKKEDKNGNLYKSAYIYFVHWYNTEAAEHLQRKINWGNYKHPAKLVDKDTPVGISAEKKKEWDWVLLQNKEIGPRKRLNLENESISVKASEKVSAKEPASLFSGYFQTLLEQAEIEIHYLKEEIRLMKQEEELKDFVHEETVALLEQNIMYMERERERERERIEVY